ncbi:hypothetical protein AB9P05_24415 [Roseivirga sp. BDSF3-8]|uniref:hypothetical protein n=1 Tax=Roseivirga sp. BDSF3-8 TaxID=3241598 RepID=UPI003531B05B
MKLKFLMLMALVAGMLFGCSEEDQIQPEKEIIPKGTATINAGSYQQNIRGFGGASIRGWIPDLTAYETQKAFDRNNGIGLSVLRVRVSPNSSDFAAERTTIDRAKSYGATVIASAWTAPAYMKSNNNTIGGTLNPSSYAAYANHLRNFVSTVGGVAAISPINEPNIVVNYESMEMTPYEVANFVAAQGQNCGAPIMAPEPFNMSQSYISQYLSNATANSKTSYIAGHIYGASPYYYNWGKEVWMTEHITDTNNANNWGGALNTAKEIHDCMVAGYSMWTHWYIRRSYGLLDESSNVTKRGYVVAQFAKWIRPGFNKVSCTANPTSGVYTTAYRNGSQLVIVAVNMNSSTTYQPFSVNGTSVSGFSRYRTTSSSNLQNDSFSVSGSNFGINLPPSSVTTLVSY